MRSIQDFAGLFKSRADKTLGEWGIPLIIVILGLTSFGLGRLSAQYNTNDTVSISSAALQDRPPLALGGLVVASRSGKAYHFPWCPGATTMKEGNKVWFKDEEAARKAGYSPAQNCEGLK